MFLALFLMDDSRRGSYNWGIRDHLPGSGDQSVAFSICSFADCRPTVLWIAQKKGRLRLRGVVPLFVGLSVLLLAVSPLVVDLVPERFRTIDLADISSAPLGSDWCKWP